MDEDEFLMNQALEALVSDSPDSEEKLYDMLYRTILKRRGVAGASALENLEKIAGRKPLSFLQGEVSQNPSLNYVQVATTSKATVIQVAGAPTSEVDVDEEAQIEIPTSLPKNKKNKKKRKKKKNLEAKNDDNQSLMEMNLQKMTITSEATVIEGAGASNAEIDVGMEAENGEPTSLLKKKKKKKKKNKKKNLEAKNDDNQSLEEMNLQEMTITSEAAVVEGAGASAAEADVYMEAEKEFETDNSSENEKTTSVPKKMNHQRRVKEKFKALFGSESD